MSGNCVHAPDYSPVCPEYEGFTHTIPGFCYCPGNICIDAYGPEWNNYTTQSCCDREPNYKSVTCIFNAKYTADPYQCCLNDYNGNKQIENCFSDKFFRVACNPIYRSSSSEACKELFHQKCIENNTEDEFLEAWRDGYCETMVSNLSKNTGDVEWVNDEMRTLFRKTLTNGIEKKGLENRFQNVLYQTCLNTPGACREALIEECSKYNKQEAQGNSSITEFCGCYLPSHEYAEYENLYGISKNCAPICARTTTIQETSVDGNKIECSGSLCIIDDVTIRLNQSSAGNISFSQICGGCEGNTRCSCTISGVNIVAVESSIGGDINLNQSCTGGINCYTFDEYGNNRKVSCNNNEEYVPTPEEAQNILKQKEKETQRRNLFIILLTVLLCVLVILIVFILIMQYVRSLKRITYIEYIKPNNLNTNIT